MNIQRYRRPFIWSTFHSAIAISILIHILILIIIGAYSPRRTILTPYFNVTMVDLNEIPPVPDKEVKSEFRENALVSDTEENSQQTILSEPPQAPPPLPSSAIFEISSTESSKDVASSPEVDYPSGQNSYGCYGASDIGKPGQGSGKKASSVDMEDGCKLFIISPSSHPITIEEAIPLCEGISYDERELLRRIEFKVSLNEIGQPYNITLTHSCGNKEVDNVAQNLMQFMRFDTTQLKQGANSYYLTLVIVGKKK